MVGAGARFCRWSVVDTVESFAAGRRLVLGGGVVDYACARTRLPVMIWVVGETVVGEI
jgi:hypothetical protein